MAVSSSKRPDDRSLYLLKKVMEITQEKLAGQNMESSDSGGNMINHAQTPPGKYVLSSENSDRDNESSASESSEGDESSDESGSDDDKGSGEVDGTGDEKMREGSSERRKMSRKEKKKIRKQQKAAKKREMSGSGDDIFSDVVDTEIPEDYDLLSEDLDEEDLEILKKDSFWHKAKGKYKNRRRKIKMRHEGRPLKERIFGLKGPTKKKSEMEFGLYVFIFLFYHYFSWLIPAVLFWVYYWYVLHPIASAVVAPIIAQTDSTWASILHFNEIFINTYNLIQQDPWVAVHIISAPFVILSLYLLRLMAHAFVGKFIYKTLNWVRPRKEMYRANFMGEQADDVNIYHTRGFLLRLLKWQFQKSPFPWLFPWMTDFIGANKIGKRVFAEEGLFAPEFLEADDDVYFAPMAGSTTHFVEGSYQALTVAGVKFGKRVVVGARDSVSPGVIMEEESQMFQFSGVTKFIHIPAGTDNFGMPASRLTYKQYVKFLDLPPEIAEIDRKIYLERRKRLKEKRRKQRGAKSGESAEKSEGDTGTDSKARMAPSEPSESSESADSNQSSESSNASSKEE